MMTVFGNKIGWTPKPVSLNDIVQCLYHLLPLLQIQVYLRVYSMLFLELGRLTLRWVEC